MPSLNHFTASRQPRWTELEGLLARSEGNGLRSFDADQIEAFARAYRQVVSDLALAQRDFPDDQLTLWLNGLAARAHLRLYRAPAPSWRRFGRFFWTDFARRFRAARPYLFVSAVLLFWPAALAYIRPLVQPTLRDALVPGVAPLVWSFISPHGYLELTCIVIAGAAGLMLGDALLRPGLRLRREALARASRRAVELAVGAAPVLVVAGLIEGFISPSDLAIEVKLVFGPLMGIGLYSLLLTVGRQRLTLGRAVCAPRSCRSACGRPHRLRSP